LKIFIKIGKSLEFAKFVSIETRTLTLENK